MAQLQLYTVTYEVPVYALSKDGAEEKARMIVASNNVKKISPQNVRVEHVGAAPRSL